MRKLIFLLAFLFGIAASPIKAQTPAATTPKEIVYYLATPELEGRFPGSKGDSLTKAFIAAKFNRNGLSPLFDTYFQAFDLAVSQHTDSPGRVKIDNRFLASETEFIPAPFSKGAVVDGEVIYVGYGLQSKSDSLKWDDYAHTDVRGKIVLMLRNLPDNEGVKTHMRHLESDRNKALLVQDMGASGVIFVSPSWDSVVTITGGLEFPLEIPVVYVARPMALELFGEDFLLSREASMQAMRGMGGKSSTNPVARHRAEMDITVSRITATTHNVAAILPGNDPVLKGQYIVIGAHHDHLGYGGHGSGSRRPDTTAVHYGADDNATGVSAVLTLAEQFGQQGSSRSLIFVTFGAEERGIIGSKYFVDNLPIPKDSITAMFNFDMLGNLRGGSLTVGGTGTSAEADSILNLLAPGTGLNLGRSPQGHGPSDHASFYAKEIPVFYFTTGGTMEYHTPDDTPDKLNYDGMDSVIQFIANVIDAVDRHPAKLTYQETDGGNSTPMRGRFKVTLGIMPDVAGTIQDGLRADIVVKDKPAHRAGLRSGDVILEIDGKRVNNIEDYMSRLGELSADTIIPVLIRREAEELTLQVEL